MALTTEQERDQYKAEEAKRFLFEEHMHQLEEEHDALLDLTDDEPDWDAIGNELHLSDDLDPFIFDDVEAVF